MEKFIKENIRFKTVPQEWDLYFDMALAMLDTVMKNNAAGKPTVMIVPVGPTDQYPIFARLVNQLNVSLKNVHFFNMDEYLISPTQPIDRNHPMSFYRRMQETLYTQIKPELNIPESQRHFPAPGKEAAYDAQIEALGGVDLCLGGLGINGHVAFNEAAEADDPISTEAFGNLGTRVLPISRETKTINAYGYQRGDLQGMPEWCITIGMKQILASRCVYIALNRSWQHGIIKHVLFDKMCPQVPGSLLQSHPNVTFCAIDAVADGLFEEQ